MIDFVNNKKSYSIFYYTIITMENIEEKNMKYACEIAKTGVDNGFGPFACIITDKDGCIISEGNNMVTMTNDPTAHAEMVAIRNACKKIGSFKLTDCILYTSCEPCPMCLSAIYWARIDKIYYGNNRFDANDIGFDDSFLYEELSREIGHRKIPMTRLCEDYAKESFRKWVEKEEKIEY
jgi:tRNA(Arg) A34 adenosine deaminase TadA